MAFDAATGSLVMYAGGQVTNRLVNGVWQKVVPVVNKASEGAKATHAVKEIAKDSIKPAVSSSGKANAATAPKLNLDLKTTQAANEVIESLKTTGKLPANYLTKAEAENLGWKSGKTPIPEGKIIGGDVYANKGNLLPSAPGRVWHEVDINYAGGKKRGGERLLYSNDGLLYLTRDHYTTAFPVGKWK